jgi:beta-lactamase class A
MLNRRNLLGLALAAAVAAPANAARASSALKDIHKKIGGRLGVHILDSQSGRRISYDDDSRYAMASTCKVPLAASILWQVDHGAFPLTHPLPISREQLLPNSPIVERMLAAGHQGMSVQDLCAAAVTFSDNTAANVLFAGIGGPAALTTFVRSIGDGITRFDRNEPSLNTNEPGDERDTTTPRAMADTMLKIFTQDVLSVASRAMLIDWMTQARTGLDRVRAGLPRNWQAADKTGTSQNGAYNNLAIAWPPGRRPIFIAAFISESTQAPKVLSTAHAHIGAVVAKEKWP